MKKILSFMLLLSITFNIFTACSSFIGGIEGFFNDSSDDFYNSVGRSINNIIGNPGNDLMLGMIGDSSYQGSLNIELFDYEYKGTKVTDGSEKFNTSWLITPDFDFTLKTSIDGFGQKADMHCVALKDEFYMDAGSFAEKPFHYKGTAEKGIFQNIKDEIKKHIMAGTYVDGEETYKFHGKNITANTVEVCLNSDVTTEAINKICDFFIETKNQIYTSYLMNVMDVSYLISGEKLHLTWKRYYNDNKLVRESFKIHDNNAHYVILDTAHQQVENTMYLEISLKAFDGNGEFDVFVLSSKTDISKNEHETGIHTTTANVLIGDEIHAEITNKGTKSGSEGVASVHFMTEVGVADLKVEFNTTDSNANRINIKTENIYITFDGYIDFTNGFTDDKPIMPEVDDVYDISVLENRYYFDEAKTMLNKEFSDLAVMLKGETPEEDPKPSEPEIPPYTLDIHYDYSIILDTNGEYGKSYVDLLNSDCFTYSYTYHSNEAGYPLNKCTQYRKNGETLYLYNYEDGTEYAQLFSGTTRYEVRHDLKKILFTEYSEEDFKKYYPEQVYIFYESGLCNYDNRELVYEKYYDHSNNKYTFIFDENKKVELIVIEDSSDKSLLYTFVEEFSDTVPENAMELPSYEYQSVIDHFQ